MPVHRNNWRVTAALFALTGIVEAFAFGHLNAFTPLYLQQLNVDPTEIPRWTGVLASLGFILGIPLLPLWGVWADRYSRKLIIVRSSYAGALMFALLAVSSNIWQVAAARLLVGLVLGNTGVMLAVQAEITPRDRLGLAIALVAAGPPLGMALGPLFGGFIVQSLGIPALLMIDAGLTAVVALLLTVLLREEPRVRRTDARVGVMLRESLRNIVTTPLVLRLFALNFLIMLSLSVVNPFVALRIERLYSGPVDQLPLIIGLIISINGLVMALSTPLWGRLSDRIGYVPVLRIGALSVGLMLLAQALAPTLWFFGGSRIGQGLVQGGIDTVLVALVALHTPEDRRASILNLSRLPIQFSWFLGPILGAALVPLGLPLLFGIAAACALVGCVATLLLDVGRTDAVEQSAQT